MFKPLGLWSFSYSRKRKLYILAHSLETAAKEVRAGLEPEAQLLGARCNKVLTSHWHYLGSF